MSGHAGAWHEGTGPEIWYVGLQVDELKQKDAELFAKGMRLVAVDIGSHKLDSAPAATPSTTVRKLSLKQEAPFSGDGGDGDWMYYSTTVQNSDPVHAKVIAKVQNASNHEIIVGHLGWGSTDVPASGATHDLDGEQFGGPWSVTLVGVPGEQAPLYLELDVTLK